MRSVIIGRLSRVSGAVSLLLLGGILSGCGPDFNPPSELHTLRVMGVQKDKPYAQPGDTVNLTMLWEDASPKAFDASGNARDITRVWSPPCFDPPGDLYYSCFSDPGLFSGTNFTFGDQTSFVMKEDVITPRPPPNAPYGLAYVFFAACAGKLQPIATSGAASGETGTIPIECLDPMTGKPLGADDFVAGYTAVYAFKGFSNKNPVVTGFEFNGQPLPSDQVCLSASDTMDPPTDSCLKIDGSTMPNPDDIDCSDPNETRCVPTCADDGDSKCHGYPLKPTLAQADNQEEDSVSAQLLGRHVTEQMWIDYYTDGGGFKSAVRLLNDATNGWNDNYGTDFYAPKAAKVSRIWALAHDNRGGVAWAGISIKTQ